MPNPNILFSLDSGFFLDEDEIDKRVTREFKELGESLELKICAIWTIEDTTEIYFIESDPSEESLATLERISESLGN